LHAAIKNRIGELLRNDARTEPDSVVINEYLIADDGRRRPDVRAIHNGLPIVIEV
jgi:type I site-specific restriction-modification system R (restriction) subunit